jgi:hypothetical protein
MLLQTGWVQPPVVSPGPCPDWDNYPNDFGACPRTCLHLHLILRLTVSPRKVIPCQLAWLHQPERLPHVVAATCTTDCAVVGTEYFTFALLDATNPEGGVKFSYAGVPAK